MSLSDALTYRRCDAFNQLQLQYRVCGIKGGKYAWMAETAIAFTVAQWRCRV
jgi:hypothetical protein